MMPPRQLIFPWHTRPMPILPVTYRDSEANNRSMFMRRRSILCQEHRTSYLLTGEMIKWCLWKFKGEQSSILFVYPNTAAMTRAQVVTEAGHTLAVGSSIFTEIKKLYLGCSLPIKDPTQHFDFLPPPNWTTGDTTINLPQASEKWGLKQIFYGLDSDCDCRGRSFGCIYLNSCASSNKLKYLGKVFKLKSCWIHSTTLLFSYIFLNFTSLLNLTFW